MIARLIFARRKRKEEKKKRRLNARAKSARNVWDDCADRSPRGGPGFFFAARERRVKFRRDEIRKADTVAATADRRLLRVRRPSQTAANAKRFVPRGTDCQPVQSTQIMLTFTADSALILRGDFAPLCAATVSLPPRPPAAGVPSSA